VDVFSLLQSKLGFTRTEAKVLLFLSVTFLAGLSVRWLRETHGEQSPPQFDYSASDSTFFALSTRPLTDSTASPHTRERMRKSAPLLHSINVNRATAREFISLPGIGPAFAERIVAYRHEHGPFQQLDDLVRVTGVGPKTLAKIKPYLSLSKEHRNDAKDTAKVGTGRD
jgi:competence protein ComEA